MKNVHFMTELFIPGCLTGKGIYTVVTGKREPPCFSDP